MIELAGGEAPPQTPRVKKAEIVRTMRQMQEGPRPGFAAPSDIHPPGGHSEARVPSRSIKESRLIGLAEGKP